MKDELIFHLVSRRKWKACQKNGYYYPEPEETDDGWILCFTADQVQEVANRKFASRENIYMLVINSRRLSNKVLFKRIDGAEYPVIQDRINLDAVMDKIPLVPNEEGLFEISIEVC